MLIHPLITAFGRRTMSSVQALRETAICPHCSLHQYVKGSTCPKCHGSLGVEFARLDLREWHRLLSDENSQLLRHEVGLAIRQLRVRRGISQGRLARMAGGIGRSQLSRVECGHVRPSISTLLRITRALGLTAIILRFESVSSIKSSQSVPRTRELNAAGNFQTARRG